MEGETIKVNWGTGKVYTRLCRTKGCGYTNGTRVVPASHADILSSRKPRPCPECGGEDTVWKFAGDSKTLKGESNG